MGVFEVVCLKAGTCEICCGTICYTTDEEVRFVKTPAGLVCEDCVDEMAEVLSTAL